LKKYKSPGSDEIPAELIHKLVNSVWNKEELPDSGRSLLLYQFTKKVTNLTNNYRGISLLSTSYTILSNILLPRLSPYIDETIGDHQCRFRHNRSNFLHSPDTGEKMAVHELFVDFKKAYDSVRREVLNILTEFGVPMKLVRLIGMCLNETYSKVHIGKHLSDSFPTKMV
jgi:hypothetical protein